MKHLLKTYVRLICESPVIDASNVEKEDIDNVLVQIIKHFDVKLIPSGESNLGWLGTGASGSVFEVEKNGKHMAMKISSFSSDALAYETILEIRKNLPGFVATALPKVYEQDSIKIDIGDKWQQNVKRFYVTFMEYLVPLPNRVKYELYSSRANSGLMPTQIRKLTNKFFSTIDEQLKSFVSEEAREIIINDNDWKKMKVELSQGNYVPGYAADEKFLSGQPILDRNIEKIANHAYNFHRKYLFHSDKLVEDILDAWEKAVPFRGKSEFPEQGTSDSRIRNLTNKKAMKLQLALRWLTKNGYLHQWNDAHVDNVMVRPSTGDYVVADVGLFEFV